MARTRRCDAYMPEELIFNIFLRLPLKSLVRFKSVCKLWQCILSSTRFVQTHLANSHKKQPVLLNYWCSRYRANKYIEVHDTHQDFVKLDLPPSVIDIAFINSCDGLVCLSNYDSSVIHIWNPSTKLFKLLPTPKKQLSRWHVHIGLGCDSICNDYKLLRIPFRDTEKDTCTAESELYSANADSWKQIEIPKRLGQLSLTYMSKLVPANSGVLYMAIGPELMAFDLHNEEFQLYPLPHFMHYSVMSNVLDFEGSVAMIFQESMDSALSLYMLDDVCGKGCWTKMFNLEADIKIDWIVSYLGCGQFIARNYVDHCVFNYDYSKGETKKCLLELSCSGMSYPVKYTESLVSPNGFEPRVGK